MARLLSRKFVDTPLRYDFLLEMCLAMALFYARSNLLNIPSAKQLARNESRQYRLNPSDR